MSTLIPSRDGLARGAGSASPAPAPAPPAPARAVIGFHGAVCEFKRRLIEATLAQSGGNRTRAARALGLQRTYLLRLIREFQIRIPPAASPPRRPEPRVAEAPTRPR